MKTVSNYRKIYAFRDESYYVACDKDDDDINDDNNMFTLSGIASGSKEVPANTTTGAATLTGTYNKSTNSLTYTIAWTGLSGNVTAAHFHGPASATEIANPMLDIVIGTNGMSGSTSGTATVTDAFETALFDGKIYYNLHTALHTGGEVRSQVTTTPQ